MDRFCLYWTNTLRVDLDFDIEQSGTNQTEIRAPKLLRLKNLDSLSNKRISKTEERTNHPKTFDLIYQGSIGTIVHYYLEHRGLQSFSIVS